MTVNRRPRIVPLSRYLSQGVRLGWATMRSGLQQHFSRYWLYSQKAKGRQMILPQKHWQHPLRFCKRVFGLFLRNFGRAIQRYGLIKGEQCAASFAYYAFFSLFPLILLSVALATLFVQDREVTARQILTQVDQYLPLQESDRVLLLHTVHGVIE